MSPPEGADRSPGQMRTIDWQDGAVVIIDQTVLPDEERLVRLTTVDELVEAIGRLAVRGAPALGVAGALGVALAARSERGPDAVRAAARRLRQARPTAVNLAWGVDRALAHLDQGAGAVLAGGLAVLEEDVAACGAIGCRGADLVRSLVGAAHGMRVLTHCNTGALACVEKGTALGVVGSLHETRDVAEVLVTETRPLLQGARLTSWELRRLDIPHRLVVDSAAASAIGRGLVDVVLVGADRIAANGDVANKVGTYPLALAATRADVPFVVAAPESTIDPDMPDGAGIEIEDRDGAEVLTWKGRRTAPAGTAAWNPAFDVTPAELVSAIVTDRRVVRPALGERAAP